MQGRLPLLIALCACLGACKSAGDYRPPQVPKTVTLTVKEYRGPPAALTRACPIAEPGNRTVGEALQVAHDRKMSLETCNLHLCAIRKLNEWLATAKPQTVTKEDVQRAIDACAGD